MFSVSFEGAENIFSTSLATTASTLEDRAQDVNPAKACKLLEFSAC
jgi:hypothetical protein